MCYFRLSRGIGKSGDLQAILNRPSRYLSGAVFKNCNFNETDLLSRCSSLKNRKTAEDNITKMIIDVSALGKINSPTEFVSYLYKKMGYFNNFIGNYASFIGLDEEEATEQLETIQEEAAEFETIDEWIAFTAEFAEKLRSMKKDREGICLSTYHASKGLEWDCVYLIDVNDGFTPYNKAQTEAEIEEERRMFYVASTRAREKLRISYIEKGNETKPSPFLIDMGVIGRTKKGIVPEKKSDKQNKTNSAEEKQKKYYVVCAGRETGVFKTLEECIAQIDGYKDAYFKSFSNKKEAEKFLKNISSTKKQKVKKQNINGKVYAVKVGKKTGIFATWSECREQIEGYSNAKYRSFKSIEAAEEYLRS